MPTDAVATAAFKADPITFLATALILPPIGNALRHNRSEHLGLRATTWPATFNGANIPVWQVAKAPNDEPYFRSYIADYVQGQTTFTTLGSNEYAEFCFTANMNGCTFGLGMQAQDGTLIVSHGNAANTGVDQNFDSAMMGQRASVALQTAIQYNRAKEGHGIGGQVFEPEHYRFGGRNSVTFGYRQRGTGGWSWYFISYLRAQGIYTSFGVQPMVTNAITN